jgi:hypothetical protein
MPRGPVIDTPMNLGRRCGHVLLVLTVLSCTARDRHRPGEDDASTAHQPETVLMSHPTGDASLACPASIAECPAKAGDVWTTLLDASEFGPTARFIASDGFSVLIDLGDAGFSIAMVNKWDRDDAGVPTHGEREFPSSDKQPIDLHGDQVVTCDDARTRCSVWHREIAAESSWREVELPEGFSARGIAYDSPGPLPTCVYGSGMVCRYDERDEWHEVISGADGLQLNAVQFQYGLSVAVGDHGRWFKRESARNSHITRPWQEQPPFGDAELTQVNVAGPTGVIVGDHRVQTLFGNPAGSFECAAPDGDLLAMLLIYGSGGYASGDGYVIASDGRIFRHSAGTPVKAEAYCLTQSIVLPGQVLDVLSFGCEFGFNPRVLTAQQLIGPEEFCAIE